jgi:tRNA nucleotidyltransferase (CCA-adding enzyme)
MISRGRITMELYNRESHNTYITNKYEKALVVVKEIFEIADSLGYNLYFAGGLVRDVFLDRKTFDIDLVLDGDTFEMYEILRKKREHKVVFHERFGVISFEYLAYNFDIAMTRTELYETSGALPVVIYANLEEDCHRRDFTINAMYLKIDFVEEELKTELITPYDGLLDLKNDKIRVLHDKSFYDDPTRLIRAVRYKVRLGIDYEYVTRDLISEAVKEDYLSNITGDRYLFELRKSLNEERVISVIDNLTQLGLLKRIKIEGKLREIHNDLIMGYIKTDEWKKFFPSRSCGVICILSMYSEEARDAILEEFILSKKIKNLIYDLSNSESDVKKISEEFNLGEIYEKTLKLEGNYKYFLKIVSEDVKSKLDFIDSLVSTNPVESSWNDFEDALLPKDQWKNTLIFLQKQRLNGIIHEYKEEIVYINKIKTGEIDV